MSLPSMEAGRRESLECPTTRARVEGSANRGKEGGVEETGACSDEEDELVGEAYPR